MDKQFLLVEDGSLDQNNMLKFLQNSGMTDANVIRYRQGATKPELVSVNNDAAELVKTVEKETVNNVLDILEKYLEANTERISQTNTDLFHPTMHVIYKTTYRGTLDELMNAFRRLLNKYIEDDNN